MFIPTHRLLLLIMAIAMLGLISSFWPAMLIVWQISIVLAVAIAVIDGSLLLLNKPVTATRQLQGSIPLGVKRDVKITLTNTDSKTQTIDIFDHFPLQVEAVGMPITTSISGSDNNDNGNNTATVSYSITAKERGKIVFPALQIRILSKLELWKRNQYLDVYNETRVYPNFAAVAHMALLATDNRLSQLGIMKKRRRGEGQDFHQLREYRDGDSLRQIDWKATSRTRKLISREYQDERDQEVIFLLDCGQRMTTKDDELSHFDHTLNAMLLLSYVALKQGDSVGLATFSGQNGEKSGEARWLSPKKGNHTIQHILNTLYDLQPSDQSPDYTQAATDLLIRHKKRALVIVLTNIRDEDSEDLSPALKILSKRHLVLLASLREEALDKALQKKIQDLPDAIRIAALHRYLQQRQSTFKALQNNKVLNVDVSPNNLTIELINSYLNIKRSGLL